MGCVLYVADVPKFILTSPGLIAAQKRAIATDLPLAVVYCVETPAGAGALEKALKNLELVEAALKEVNIPFIVLVGDTRERLKGTFEHLKPDAVYFGHPSKVVAMFTELLAARDVAPNYIEKNGSGEPAVLVKHTQDWPGPVISIVRLEQLAAVNQIMC